MRRRLFPTRFERCYIRLYNDRISLNQFLDKCGIEDRSEAWKTLCKYRMQVVQGEIPDPRDIYHRWRKGGAFS